MSCAGCGFENPPGMKFCGECGQPLQVATPCPSCGFESPPGFKFCGECGAALGGARPEIPRHLADKIREARPTLEGERKQVTVLFADVKGSTALTEQAGPERWAEVLEGYLKLLAEGVHRYEGTVSQYTGDGLMALFGAPIAHEDHAARSCLSALWLRDALADYAEEVKREHGLVLETRIGLNSGEVVVGKIGEDLGMDFTAQGQTVHLAHRMEQLAQGGRPCLAPAAAALVEGLFALEDRGEFEVKGASAPLRVHALVGPGEAATRLEAARSRGLSPFVGRVHELEVLDAALAQARDGGGQIVGVVGEAGVGKSRLCAQFLERVRDDGTPVYAAHCLSHGETLSNVPIRELLRALLAVSEGDAADDQRRRIADRLQTLDEDARAIALPLLFDFLDVAEPGEPGSPLAPEARQLRLFDLVRRLVRTASSDEPAVLFLDDAHWIDAGSDAFLAQIAEAVADTQTLLLVNFRPEYQAEWMGRSEYQQLPLRRLGAEETEALLDELVGRDASLAKLRERIRARTGGNPFFVEEVVRSLAETGALAGTRGAYRRVEPIQTLEVPATVQPVLAARIDRLGEREKQALQAAAVIGREFSEPILSTVLDWPEGEISQALRQLKEGEFVLQRALHPAPEYEFRHPLTQEVALGSQLRERRARTHAAVARALESAHADRPEPHAALIAHHYEEAGEGPAAVRWHRRAAAWLQKSDQPESWRHWKRVYALGASQPESPEILALRQEACWHLLMNSYIDLSDDERDRLLAEGRELTDRLGDPRGSFMLETALIASEMLGGWSSRAPLEATRRAVVLAEKLDLEMRVGSLANAFNIFWAAGRVNEALQMADEALAQADGNLDLGVAIAGFSFPNLALFQKARFLMWLGRPGEAAPCFDRCLQVARARDDFMLPQILGTGGVAFEELTGVPQRALERGRESIGWAERFGELYTEVMTRLYLGWAELRHGCIAEALESLRFADQVQRERGRVRNLLNLGQGLLAEACLAAGDAEGARAAADRCIVQRDNWVYELRANLSRSRVLRALDGAEARSEIEATLARAQQLLEWSAARAFGPFIVEERARLLEVLGDTEGAERALREAQRAFADVDATGHVERLAEELGR